MPHSSPPRKLWFWLVCGLLFVAFLSLIRSILLPFVVGGMVAYFLDPAADALERRGCSRNAATTLITLGFFTFLLLILSLLTPILFNQVSDLISAIPHYVAHMREVAQPYLEKINAFLPMQDNTPTQEVLPSTTVIFDTARKVAGSVFASGKAGFEALSLIFLTPVVAFYFLRDWDVMVAKVNDLLPRAQAETIRIQIREIDTTIAAYLRGQVNVCLLLSVYYMMALWIVGLQYGILVGLMSGVIAFIPFIGAMVGFGTAIGLAVFQFDGFSAIGMVVGAMALGLMLESHVLVPKLVGQKVGLHPAWVIFGMLSGGAILGFVGVLLAVPLTAIIGVLVRFATQRYRSSAYYHGDGQYVLAIIPEPVAPESDCL